MQYLEPWSWFILIGASWLIGVVSGYLLCLLLHPEETPSGNIIFRRHCQ